MKRLLAMLLTCLLVMPCLGTDFDGADDWVNCGDVTGVVTLTSPWTLCGWGKLTTVPTEGQSNRLIGIGNTSDASAETEHITIGVQTNSGVANIKIVSSGETAGSGSAISTGQWYAYTLVYDGADFHLYLDGAWDYSVTPSGSGWQSASYLKIAKQPHSSAHFWIGQIDDVRLYNRALSAAEVEALYRATRNLARKRPGGALANGLVAHYEMRDGAIGADVSGASAVHDSTANGNHGTGEDGSDGSLLVTAPARK